MSRVKVKVRITDKVSPPGEPVVVLRVPKGGKAVFRRANPNKSLEADMQIPEERIQELQTMGYEVEEVKPKAKAEPKASKEEKKAEKAEEKEES